MRVYPLPPGFYAMPDDAKPFNPFSPEDAGFDPELDLPPEVADDTPAPKKADAPSAPAPPTEQKPAAKAPEKPAHAPRVLRLARELGISEADIAATDPAELSDWVMESLDRIARQPAAAKPSPAPEPEEDYGFGEYEDEDGAKKKVDLSGYERPIRHVFKTLAQELKAIKAENAELKESTRRREARDAYDAFDAAFESLGDAGKAIFGDGPGTAMDTASEESQRRHFVLQAAKLKAGDSPAVIKKKIAAAVKTLYGPVGGDSPAPKKAAKDAPAETPADDRPRAKNGRFTAEEWEEAALAKPTSRTPPPAPKGEKLAMANLAKKMHRFGMPVEDDGSDD